jgi:Domain of unknown function (DUF4386)
METIVPSKNKIARSAGILYIVLVGIALYGMGYVSSKIFVPNDVTAITADLISNEFLFRTGIACHLLSVSAISIMVLILYRLFRPVDKHLSRLMLVPVLVQIPIVLIIVCFNIAALMILKGEAWMNLDSEQRQQYAYFLLRMHSYGIVLHSYSGDCGFFRLEC